MTRTYIKKPSHWSSTREWEGCLIWNRSPSETSSFNMRTVCYGNETTGLLSIKWCFARRTITGPRIARQAIPLELHEHKLAHPGTFIGTLQQHLEVSMPVGMPANYVVLKGQQ